MASFPAFPQTPPSLCQPVGVHPCCHVHQSWAGCQSDRLTSQKATSRLGNSRYNRTLLATSPPGTKARLVCWDQASGMHSVRRKVPEHLACPDSRRHSCPTLSPLLVPRTPLNLSGADTVAHPPACHPAQCLQSQAWSRHRNLQTATPGALPSCLKFPLRLSQS